MNEDNGAQAHDRNTVTSAAEPDATVSETDEGTQPFGGQQTLVVPTNTGVSAKAHLEQVVVVTETTDPLVNNDEDFVLKAADAGADRSETRQVKKGSEAAKTMQGMPLANDIHQLCTAPPSEVDPTDSDVPARESCANVKVDASLNTDDDYRTLHDTSTGSRVQDLPATALAEVNVTITSGEGTPPDTVVEATVVQPKTTEPEKLTVPSIHMGDNGAVGRSIAAPPSALDDKRGERK